jgi:hypothetical protein
VRHGFGNSEAAGDSGACDRHVDSGAESPEDSARRFAALASVDWLVFSVAENGIYSVVIILELASIEWVLNGFPLVKQYKQYNMYK